MPALDNKDHRVYFNNINTQMKRTNFKRVR
jgi:hypothetical protein